MIAASGDDPLGPLIEGEVETLEAMFEVYEPYLRAIIRRQLSDRLRAKFDSVDVVQSVWVQLIEKLGQDGLRINDREHLRALLVTIARRRLVNRVRRFDRDEDHRVDEDQSTVSDLRHPSPSETAQANDLWEKMLRLTPPDHHQVLILRREGLPLAEIANRTGLHEGSVRRIIRRLSRELTLREEPLPPATSNSNEVLE